MEHLPAGALSVYTYHGSGRGISAINLAEHDIVLTTYNIVGELCDGADVPMRKKAKVVSALSGVKWKVSFTMA
jgi:SWI/SNF-related matrix-associated actin-dependent regulator of chromatin subfamily A3